MAEDAPVLLTRDARGIATATLNRPQVGNAYNAAMLEGLIGALGHLATDPGVRALVLRGAGRHFAAGADINWLSEVPGLCAGGRLSRPRWPPPGPCSC